MRLKITFYSILLFSVVCSVSIQAQEGASLFGALQTNANFFIRDTAIGAANIPQYDNQKFGAEAWLNLNYIYKNIEIGVRYDLFNNSNLLNPTQSYTGQGIGMYFAAISIGKLDLRAGYIYDQIGSGLIYRAYEIRPLLFDNALRGVRAEYHINDQWSVKGFTGQQKYLFDNYGAIIKGGSIDGYHSFGDENPITIAPGLGVVSRTITDNNANAFNDILRNYFGTDRVDKFKYNAYLASIYSTFSYKGFSLYGEYAYKTPDVFLDPFAVRTFPNGTTALGRYVKEPGTAIYTSLGFAAKGLGITVEARRSENFNFRTDQTLSLNRGLINFIPPLIRQNTYRLTARYSPAIQDVSEMGIQADVRYKFNKKLSALVNYSNIQRLDNEPLYQEFFAQALYKPSRKWRLTMGTQLQLYNQSLYEGKPENITPNVRTITPFIDILYKLSRRNSIRFESQYMSTEQDYGSWIFALIDIGLAPHWQFEASAMYNVIPNSENPNIPIAARNKKILYPTLGAVYTQGSNRYSLRYVKQVEGIVCSGGVCRLEPAFSGFKFEINSTF